MSAEAANGPIHAIGELDGWKFSVHAGPFDAINFTCVFKFEANLSEEELIKISNHTDRYPVDSTYEGIDASSGIAIMSLNYRHVVPEDETISAGYIVKLARYFIKHLELQKNHWPSIVKAALKEG
tara:strand:- start:56 stop:430 length:375 start_codon:yes stop_codon:yes gene_type:complete